MKNNVILSVIFFGLFACTKKNNETEKNSVVEQKKGNSTELPCSSVTNETPASLETLYGCNNTKYQMQIALNNTYKIIKNQTEFNNLVTGNCLPTIDFSKYDLLIGKKGMQNGCNDIIYSLSRNCGNNTMNIDVIIKKDLTLVAPNITYHALLPKLKSNEQLSVNIGIQ